MGFILRLILKSTFCVNVCGVCIETVSSDRIYHRPSDILESLNDFEIRRKRLFFIYVYSISLFYL